MDEQRQTHTKASYLAKRISLFLLNDIALVVMMRREMLQKFSFLYSHYYVIFYYILSKVFLFNKIHNVLKFHKNVAFNTKASEASLTPQASHQNKNKMAGNLKSTKDVQKSNCNIFFAILDVLWGTRLDVSRTDGLSRLRWGPNGNQIQRELRRRLWMSSQWDSCLSDTFWSWRRQQHPCPCQRGKILELWSPDSY